MRAIVLGESLEQCFPTKALGRPEGVFETWGEGGVNYLGEYLFIGERFYFVLMF